MVPKRYGIAMRQRISPSRAWSAAASSSDHTLFDNQSSASMKSVRSPPLM
ncbi:MAG: hypothetical protein HYX33_01555 [Actinobacteria bacterium]|nr:hypothetical protein [Actinomycetota bacterium]